MSYLQNEWDTTPLRYSSRGIMGILVGIIILTKWENLPNLVLVSSIL